MKNILYSIVLTLLCFPVLLTAQTQENVLISGKLEKYNPGFIQCYYQLNEDSDFIIDSIPLTKDGLFEYKLSIESPVPAYLVYPEAGATSLFLDKGMKAKLLVSFLDEDGQKYAQLKDYEGDNADCTKFMADFEDWSFSDRWSFDRLDTLTFADYRKLFLMDIDSLKGKLNNVKSLAFRRMMRQQIDDACFSGLFRYAWSVHRQNDPDLIRFAESIDRNDPENIPETAYYFRWYEQRNPLPKEGDKDINYLNRLKNLFSNQDVVNAFADEYMESLIKDAPENLSNVFDYYKTISTNSVVIARLDSLYEHYRGMMQGNPAIDFDMIDREGKVWHLSDFKGKALYIDIWATWCGPCLNEVPFLTKLVEHYKGNDKIEFIAVSLDDNKAAWEKKVNADNHPWRQFFCPDNFKSQLALNYSVDAIPRFLFFNENGEVISLNAPRPSFEGIIEYLDKWLE